MPSLVQIDAFVDDNKGLTPDASDVRALDLMYTRFIHPELEELGTEHNRLSALFAGHRPSSSVTIDGTSTVGNNLLEAHHWPQTKEQYIFVHGLKLSSNRLLELEYTCKFNGYTGKGHEGFHVEFSIQ